MYPWRRILIPTDFSTAAEWAFDDAVRIAGSTGGEVIILHIRMSRTSNPSELRFPADPKLYEYAEQHELDLLRDRVRRAHASVATRLVVKQAPIAGEAICRTAVEEDADLIVISTHARHHVAHLLIGSTTTRVLADPPAPVLAIRYGTHKRSGMKRLVVPVHLRQAANPALDLATQIAARERAEVHVVTVCRDEDAPAAEQLLGDVSGRSLTGVNAKTIVIRGKDVDRELIRYVEKSESDAVFLNAVTETKEMSELKKDIVRHLPVPVMLVPPPK